MVYILLYLERSIVERAKRAHDLTISSNKELCEICGVCGMLRKEMDQLLPQLKQEEDERLNRLNQQPGTCTVQCCMCFWYMDMV